MGILSLRESCIVFSSEIINAACSMPEFILCGSKLFTQFSILLKMVRIRHRIIVIEVKLVVVATPCPLPLQNLFAGGFKFRSFGRCVLLYIFSYAGYHERVTYNMVLSSNKYVGDNVTFSIISLLAY